MKILYVSQIFSYSNTAHFKNKTKIALSSPQLLRLRILVLSLISLLSLANQALLTLNLKSVTSYSPLKPSLFKSPLTLTWVAKFNYWPFSFILTPTFYFFYKPVKIMSILHSLGTTNTIKFK